ncbi:MAG: hypothetical protein JWO93_99 [Micrococcaceae bacterium]|nr:hypothetical protein [Micrococcaceae bacterium]
MSGSVPAAGFRQLDGHNRVSAQALSSVAKAVAAESFHVPPAEVRTSWSDDRGLLVLALSLPAAVPPLVDLVRDPAGLEPVGGSLWDRALAAQENIRQRVTGLTGAEITRVDVRITGIRSFEGGRVR